MRDVLISLAWMAGSLAVCGACSWLLVRRYPDALDRVPDEGWDDEMGALPATPPQHQVDA